MKTKHSFAGLMVVALLSGGTAFGQDKKPDARELEKAFREFATPGKEHEYFKRLAGRWDAVVTSYYGNPNKPVKSKATSSFRVIMGGRFLQQRVQGEVAGMKFEGQGWLGYDNAKKKYVGAWIDNTSTGIMQTEGTYDPKTQTLTEVGTSSSPIGPMKMKTVSRFADRNNFTQTMYLITKQGERKMLEVAYTRAKKKRTAGTR